MQNLPNINHPDFAALDRFINGVKANVFAPTAGVPGVGAQAYGRAIEQLQNFGIVADFLGFHDTITLFRRTHQRLYQMFGTIDQNFAACNQPGVLATWADTYSEWMTGCVQNMDLLRNSHNG